MSKDSIKTDKKLLHAAKSVASKVGEIENITEIVDKETFESPAKPQALLPLILQGCDVPSHVRGPFSKIDRQRWLLVVENMLVKGVKSGREISRLTGLTAMTANNFVKEVKEAMSQSITPTRINQTREILYTENETISNFCWNLINSDPTSNQVPQLLKIIGDTNTRRSRLMGVENINLNVGEQKNLVHFDVEMAQFEAAKKLNVSVDALKQMGDNIAKLMLNGPKKGDDNGSENSDD